MGHRKPLRQFIYSGDLAALTVWVLRSYDSTDPIILSVPEEKEVTIKDVALMIRDAMEFKGEVKFLTDKADGQYKRLSPRTSLETSRASDADFQFTPMAEGLKISTQDKLVLQKNSNEKLAGLSPDFQFTPGAGAARA